jgi:hypothetical protein
MGLIIYIIIGLVLVACPFVLESRIAKLPDNSKFKNWWRKHIIADYEE